tara:strand:- start:820 stop:963 length:144 start_codon:yes stop_codon:yes gene_type:complete
MIKRPLKKAKKDIRGKRSPRALKRRETPKRVTIKGLHNCISPSWEIP